MSKTITVKTVGDTEKTLTVYPVSKCGRITDGVALENGNTGGWVISYTDFLKIERLVKRARRSRLAQPNSRINADNGNAPAPDNS